MTRKLYVNLPVADLAASVDFFTKLGFTFDATFTDENATCMIVNDDAAFMLLSHARYRDFTGKEIVDARTHTEAIFAFSADSREQVDELVHTALAHGGAKSQDAQDHGFMYGWSFQDLDGHSFEVMWMDPAGYAG
ncbi:MAG: VOC family protein [Pseudonocardiales bacterium]|jgi:uncharacterized protein|nr:VOC family protein [Pseudonocardiales bacterium]